ncbi:hypothetical protein [Burkholderia thailandensis]|uniref:hypothetical protein n=1 Tax=Burkholderia thailandensis TaxID=57975 RepID=UPI0022AC6132|nr:hypothetical protein [Burkholderia thailandensis]MCZ2903673.1 hypothetical protein [Burkholderia thailandensis]MDD1484640.1 hypothetical protein [Burkholderia thailandensis]MDD1490625.1 hypothetical protein [Burkholderia thailandensis]MDD1496730.1 hypothetical protein [Burkholderia thailandensis]
MPKIAIFDRDVRWRRRQLVRSRALLSPRLFCQQRGISNARLLQLERRGEVFSVIVGRKPYFPAVLADGSLDQHRLEKLLKRLSPDIPPIAKYLFLVGRRGSLGDKTVLHAMRSGKRYRMALRLADNIASDHGQRS